MDNDSALIDRRYSGGRIQMLGESLIGRHI
jgi:hypothetical protein